MSGNFAVLNEDEQIDINGGGMVCADDFSYMTSTGYLTGAISSCWPGTRGFGPTGNPAVGSSGGAKKP